MVDSSDAWGQDEEDERVGDFWCMLLILNGLLAERVRMESKK